MLFSVGKFELSVSYLNLMTPIPLDNLTSTQSTFPYNSTDCEIFRSLLISSRGKGNAKFLHFPSLTPCYLERINDGRTVSIVGRLWSIISKPGSAPHYTIILTIF